MNNTLYLLKQGTIKKFSSRILRNVTVTLFMSTPRKKEKNLTSSTLSEVRFRQTGLCLVTSESVRNRFILNR